jgi:hypothetical protein
MYEVIAGVLNSDSHYIANATTMMKYLTLILSAPAVASAFVLQPPLVVRPSFALHKNLDSFDAASAADVDMARAKECAEKFGVCSVKEVEKLRDCEYTILYYTVSCCASRC